jgi:hypothetical protein
MTGVHGLGLCIRARLQSCRSDQNKFGLKRVCENHIFPREASRPVRKGWDIDFATSSERQRRGTRDVASAAPLALRNFDYPFPSPSGLGSRLAPGPTGLVLICGLFRVFTQTLKPKSFVIFLRHSWSRALPFAETRKPCQPPCDTEAEFFRGL